MPLQSARMLRSRLRSGDWMLGDGAMGSELIRRGIDPARTLSANLDQPSLVADIHRQYLEAGAEMLTSNTFGCMDSDAWERAFDAGVGLAFAAAREHPAPVSVWISVAAATVVRDATLVRFLEQYLAAHPGMVLIETATSLYEAVSAVEAVHALRPEMIAACCHFGGDGTMNDGTKPEQAALALVIAGAELVGGNCGDSPEVFIEAAAQMRAVTDRPLIYRPSAGLPIADAAGRLRYPATSETFCTIAEALYAAGANIVGGCCGTTPDYIAAIRARLDDLTEA